MPFLQCFGCRTRRNTQVDKKTFRILSKASALIARLNKQFGDSTVNPNTIPQSTQVDDPLVSSTNLPKLKDRLARFENYRSNTPPNTRKYKKIQKNYNILQQKICDIEENEM